MAQHLSAFYESVDPDGVLTQIAAVQDQTVFTSGDDIRAPVELPFIIGEVALSAAANLVQAQIQSPSLRTIAQLDVEPIVNAVVFGEQPEIQMHPLNPVPVNGDEQVNFAINSNPAAAESHYGLVFFADGVQNPVNGEIYTVRADSESALVAGSWVNSNLTFEQSLPVGTYQVVGMRARGTNLVAARLVFVGGTWRAGVPAVNAISDRDPALFRYGRMGVFGEFHTNTPPTIDCLGITDVAQDILLDVIRVG